MSTACRASQRIRALSLALDCARLGARVRTIHQLTGMRPNELLYLLFSEQRYPPRGRTPDAREWYPTATLLDRIEASVVVSTFDRLHSNGFRAPESLVAAYRYYHGLYGLRCHIGFDRAFDLVSHVAGLWIADSASLQLVTCTICASAFVDTPSVRLRRHEDCPFCRLPARHQRDPRIAAFFRGTPSLEQATQTTMKQHVQPSSSSVQSLIATREQIDGRPRPGKALFDGHSLDIACDAQRPAGTG